MGTPSSRRRAHDRLAGSGFVAHGPQGLKAPRYAQRHRITGRARGLPPIRRRPWPNGPTGTAFCPRGRRRRQVGKHALQPPVLVPKGLHLPQHGRIHASMLDPLSLGRARNTAPARARPLLLTQPAQDLDFGEAALLHRNPLVDLTERTPPSHPPTHKENCPLPRRASEASGGCIATGTKCVVVAFR